MTVSKQARRNKLKAIRDGIPPQRRKEASERTCAEIIGLLEPEGFILSFPSFGSEIDLWPLNQELAHRGRLVLPRISGKDLILYQVDHLTHLEPHTWGQLEPVPSLCRQVDLNLIEIVLVPGLAFDLNTKHRLGYGGGHYDRLLATGLPGLQKWGVGFREQAMDGLPSEAHDIVMDEILVF